MSGSGLKSFQVFFYKDKQNIIFHKMTKQT